MSGYPKDDILLATCRAGLGKIVIVEGESIDQDPYYYGRWFGDLARELTFIPQNGCELVVRAVAYLREHLAPAREVYGIRDRDFHDEPTQGDSIPADGVLCPTRYTMENYLLEPEGWFEVVKLVHRSTRPAGWDSVAAVHEQILAAYRKCLPLAAFNFTVKQDYARLPADPSGTRFGYRHHPDSVNPSTLGQLDAWGAERGLPGLREQYDVELARLTAASFTEWQQRVTGKAVIKVFHGAFPGVNARHLLDNLYLDKYPQPPADLDRLVRRMLTAPWLT